MDVVHIHITAKIRNVAKFECDKTVKNYSLGFANSKFC